MENITNDPLLSSFRESLGNLSDDLFWRDAQGNRCFDANAAKTLAATISEAIKKEFKYLALPPVIHEEDDTTLILENLIISATLPDAISFHLESFATLDMKTWDVSVSGSEEGQQMPKSKPNMNTEIFLTATTKGITFCAPNIAFTYKGTALADSGVVTIRVPEPGADLAIDFVLVPTEQEGTGMLSREERKRKEERREEMGRPEEGEMRVRGHGYRFMKIKAHFSVPTLDVNFDKATIHHDILLPFLLRFFKSSMVSRFEEMVEDFLNEGLRSLGERVTSILNEAPNPLSLSSLQGMMGEVVE